MFDSSEGECRPTLAFHHWKEKAARLWALLCLCWLIKQKSITLTAVSVFPVSLCSNVNQGPIRPMVETSYELVMLSEFQ